MDLNPCSLSVGVYMTECVLDSRAQVNVAILHIFHFVKVQPNYNEKTNHVTVARLAVL